MPGLAPARAFGALTFEGRGGLLRPDSSARPQVRKQKEAMPMDPVYEIYAIRYATMTGRTPPFSAEIR